jgi:hypothetical protein
VIPHVAGFVRRWVGYRGDVESKTGQLGLWNFYATYVRSVWSSWVPRCNLVYDVWLAQLVERRSHMKHI